MPAWEPGEFSFRQWPDWDFWRAADAGRSGLTRGRAVGLVANIVAVLALFLGLSSRENNTASTCFLIATAVCYGLAFPIAAWFGPACSHRHRIAIVVGMFVLGFTPALVLGSPRYLTVATFAITIGLMLLPLRWSVPLGSATAALQIGWMWVGDDDVSWAAPVTLIGVTAVLGLIFALTFTIGHLRAARDQVRHLAVAQERERVARDLHDILGHSLSTMTLKTGLARRLLETTGDIARATAEIRELEDLTRQALSDVRATVSDYRTVTLAAEIAGARVALRAAGIAADLPAAADDVDPRLHEVFGYVVREAVTNIIRHSAAANCQIRLGRDWVAVTDDGATADPGPSGNGLIGLAERLTAVSGDFDHGPRPGGGWQVVARGPSPQAVGAPTDTVERSPAR